MLKLCISLRPGTLLRYKDKTWRVDRNDTLDQTLKLRTINSPTEYKYIRYRTGQEVTVRWTPDSRA